MFNVCPNCGEYHANKRIEPKGPYAICPKCGYKHKFVRLPLFVITGASGTGKTAICLELVSKMPEVIIMESDILWREEFDQPETNYREYREVWLRVCKNISQGLKPVVLCGCGVPSQFEECVERRYFTKLHYLALTCGEKLLASRLRKRPDWRSFNSETHIKEHVRFNCWLIDNANKTNPSMTILDTSEISIQDAAKKVAEWIRDKTKG